MFWLVSGTMKTRLEVKRERKPQMPRDEVSQDLMRFWSYESIFWTIL